MAVQARYDYFFGYALLNEDVLHPNPVKGECLVIKRVIFVKMHASAFV